MAIWAQYAEIFYPVVISVTVYVIKLNWYSTICAHLMPTTQFALWRFPACQKETFFQPKALHTTAFDKNAVQSPYSIVALIVRPPAFVPSFAGKVCRIEIEPFNRLSYLLIITPSRYETKLNDDTTNAKARYYGVFQFIVIPGTKSRHVPIVLFTVFLYNLIHEASSDNSRWQ